MSTLEIDTAGIGDEPGAALPVVSAVAGPHRPGIVAVETEQAPVLASLVAGGRMKPERGRVLLDGHDDPAALRRSFALVDTPGVAEPFPVMTLRRIVREELAFAEQRPSREHVDTVLDELGMSAYADTAVQRVPTDVRVRLLVELALLRDGVTGLVITSPERHGGSVESWFAVVRDVAQRGVTVLLVTSKAAAETAERLLATIPAPNDDLPAEGTSEPEGPDDATRPTEPAPGLQADTATDATAPLETRS